MPLLIYSSFLVAVAALVSLVQAQSLVIQTEKPLRVASGRTVTLLEDHIRVKVVGDPAQSLTSCKIVVLRGGNAVTERVGKLSPGVFSCQFAANGDSITYSHNGSPLLDSDTVALRVFAFGNFSNSPMIRDVLLHVEVTQRPNDKLVLFGNAKGGLECVLSGLSEDLDKLRMAFSYDIADNVTCSLFYNASMSPFPAKGHLVDRQGKTLDHFTIDCWEFAFSGIRYRHQKPFSPAVDYIPLTAKVLLGGESGRIVEEEHVYIPVRILGALENYPPQVLASSTLKLTLKSPYLTLFTSEMLSFVDWDINDASRLVVNISQQPHRSLGYFVNLLRPTERISSFTVGDLNTKLIAFQPAPRIGTDSGMLTGSGEARFEAFDELFARSEQVTVQISLSYSSMSFPRARIREALYVLRGLPQPITTREIELLSGKDAGFKKPQIQRVFFEKPKCGKILLRKTPSSLKEASSFSLNDLNNQAVVYSQNLAQNCSGDFIVVHIQDDFVELRLGLPVYVVPRAVVAPSLITRKPLVVRQALQAVLDRNHLLALPNDNSTEGRCRKCVTYRVVKMPKFGTLELSSNVSIGNVLTTFTQHDVDDGLIHYQHKGTVVEPDEITLRLEDDEGNEAEESFLVPIQVKPYSPEKSSAALSNANVATLNESDFLILSEKHLKYKYPTASDREIEYVVVRPPYFLETDGTKTPIGDAGKLVIFSSGNMPARRSSEQIVSFTQNDVKDGRVAYFAPNSDIGSRARVAQFVFDVKGPEGVAKAQVFKINILPINNKPPRVHETTLTVRAGDSINLLPALNIEDSDSPPEKISIAIEQTPRHGSLIVNGTTRLSLGDKFAFEDLANVQYQHDPNSNDRSDTFRLMAFDGQYHSSGTVSVTIQQPDVLDKMFVSNTEVVENERVSLVAKDAKSFIANRFPGNSTMKFLVVRPPFYGKLLLNDREVRKFYSRDLVNGTLEYSHPPNAESGSQVFEDSLTILGIATSSDLLLDSHQLLLRTISIKIQPKDNRPPRFEIIGMPQMLEGHSTKIDASMIVVDDVDSPGENLLLEIVTLPKLGCLTLLTENAEHADCLTTGHAVNVTQFRLGEVFLGYNHTKHLGSEATSDSFEIRASDGLHQSQIKQFTIEILPDCDEIPSMHVNEQLPTLHEGAELELTKLFTVTDADQPAENLTLIFLRYPFHGSIESENGDGTREALTTKNNKTVSFRATESFASLMYKHDGSENLKDSFVVQVSDGTFTTDAHQIDINLKAIDDEKPQLINSGEVTRVLGNDQRKIVLGAADLKVEDADSSPTEIIFAVVEKPKHLTLNVDGAVSSSFTQADVDQGLVSLLVPTIDHKVMLTDQLTLSVSSGEQRFTIPEISMPFKLVRENALTVNLEVGTEFIGKSFRLNNVTELDQFEASSIVFIPANVSGQDCFLFSDSSFTMEDMLAGKISVIAGQAFSPLASCHKLIDFEIRLLPLKSSLGRLSVNFTLVMPEVEVKPEIRYEVVKHPGIIERLAKRVFGFVLTNKHLSAIAHFGSQKSKLEDAVYEVTRSPMYGILADLSATTSSLDSLVSFTQQQIDSKQIVYVLTKLVNTMTSDSFDFNVLDGSTRRPILEQLQFDVEWAFVEFEQDHFVVCEGETVAKIPVRRIGYVNSTATAQVRLRQTHHDDLSDKNEVSTIEKELKFEPNVDKIFLEVNIDSEIDNNKPIRALLRSPVNTLLGSTRKLAIKVSPQNRAPCNNGGQRSVQTSLVEPVESVGSLTESRRVFNLRSKMLEDDDDLKDHRRPSRPNKACQTGWMPLHSLGKTCYAQLPLATQYWDAHKRCKALGGRLPSAANMSPAMLRELSELSGKKPLWVDAPNMSTSKKVELNKPNDQSRSCAVIRNMAIALRRCKVAKASVVCIADL